MNQHQRESRTGEDSYLRVIQFSREVCPFSNRDHSWQQFHAFRNGVLDILALRSVGPSGKMPILDSYEESQNARVSTEGSNPDFFVVDDDMYGLSVRVEADCKL